MSLKDYVLDPLPIGVGMSGVVQRAKRVADGAWVAIKRFKPTIDGVPLTRAQQAKNRREVDLLKQLHHPNVVHPADAFFNSATGEFCIVQELCDGGELPSYLCLLEEKRLPLAEHLPFATCLIGALHYLHALGIMHR
jgi:serine/threonine protein kinase